MTGGIGRKRPSRSQYRRTADDGLSVRRGIEHGVDLVVIAGHRGKAANSESRISKPSIRVGNRARRTSQASAGPSVKTPVVDGHALLSA